MPPPQLSVSQKALAANRTNAAKSTGPPTPQRKVRSAQNARKHRFTASTFAVVLTQQALLRAAPSRSSKGSALRHALPNDAIFDAQPEPKETT